MQIAVYILLDLVRTAALLIYGFCLTGCVTLQPSGVQVVGLIWLVSRDDIRQAVARDQAEAHPGRSKAIDHAEVVSRTEIRIFHNRGYPGYDEIKLIKRKWQRTARVVVLD